MNQLKRRATYQYGTLKKLADVDRAYGPTAISNSSKEANGGARPSSGHWNNIQPALQQSAHANMCAL